MYTNSPTDRRVSHQPTSSSLHHPKINIYRFYAPWCGHCQSLKPAYEKAAKNLDGLAKVAAISCDDDDNKPLCGRMGVQGFPTLKIMTPSKKPGKPTVKDYQGARSAKAIVDAVVDRIPNHVKRLTDKDLETWVDKDEAPKAILFTEKGTTSALIRAIAIDFLGSIKVGQVRSKETGAAEKFDVENFPALVLLPGGDKEPIVYDGELKKKPIVDFLSQVATPNPDPAPAKTKAKPSSKSKSKSTKPAKAQSSTVYDDEAENLKPTESPDHKVIPDDAKESKPASVPIKTPEIKTLPTIETLESTCLAPKSGTCVLALLPEPKDSDSDLPGPAQTAVSSLSDIAHKHTLRQSNLFPFYSVPAINAGGKSLRVGLGLPEGTESVEIIAVNGRRGWWRRYDNSESQDFNVVSVEKWIDSIRLGDGKKEKLPEGVVVAGKEADKHDEL